jgi:hypothetical protein
MARLDSLRLWAVAGLGIFLQPWSLVAARAATVVQAKLSTAGDRLTLLVGCWLLGNSTYLIVSWRARINSAFIASQPSSAPGL